MYILPLRDGGGPARRPGVTMHRLRGVHGSAQMRATYLMRSLGVDERLAAFYEATALNFVWGGRRGPHHGPGAQHTTWLPHAKGRVPSIVFLSVCCATPG